MALYSTNLRNGRSLVSRFILLVVKPVLGAVMNPRTGLQWGKSNIADWKMDPEWRCIDIYSSYWKKCIFQLPAWYVSLPEGWGGPEIPEKISGTDHCPSWHLFASSLHPLHWRGWKILLTWWLYSVVIPCRQGFLHNEYNPCIDTWYYMLW